MSNIFFAFSVTVAEQKKILVDLAHESETIRLNISEIERNVLYLL